MANFASSFLPNSSCINPITIVSWIIISLICNFTHQILFKHFLQYLRGSLLGIFLLPINILTRAHSFIINKITRNLSILFCKENKRILLFFRYHTFDIHFLEAIIRVTDFFIQTTKL